VQSDRWSEFIDGKGMEQRIFATYLQQYQAFQQQVENCLLLLRSVDLEVATIVAAMQQLNGVLQIQWDEAAATLPPHLIAIQVEINKQLRLLSTDVMFLRTAKKPENRQSRQSQMVDRLTLLERYCEQAIALLDGSR
jgi:hypothetical protein